MSAHKHSLSGPSSPFRRYLPRFLLVVLAIVVVVLSILAYRWPFTRERSIERLEHFAESKTQVRNFTLTFFPYPGYIAEGLSFSRNAQGTPVTLVTVERLTCRASWWTMLLLVHHLKDLRIMGIVAHLPSKLPEPMHLHAETKESTSIGEVIADGALLEFDPKVGNQPPLRFDFPELLLKHVSENKSTGIQSVVHIPEPSGRLAIKGNFGPVDTKKLLQTPISGTFNLDKADLGSFRSLSGLLSSSGSFQGNLADIQVQGTANVPNFALQSSGNQTSLRSKFRAVVKGDNGDVSLESAQIFFPNMTIDAHGSITGQPDQPGKTVSLDIAAKQGRVEDLLRLFQKSNPPALDGNISFQAHAELPDGDEPFLRRVGLTGSFRVDRAQFAKLPSRNKVDVLSAHARGDKREEEHPAEAPTVVFDFNAPALTLRDGKAHFTNTSFTLPGASARGAGTYNLLNEAIDWNGSFAMQTDLSQATTGLKSVLLKPLSPFFRGKHSGTVLPIHVGGTYAHPVFILSLKGKK